MIDNEKEPEVVEQASVPEPEPEVIEQYSESDKEWIDGTNDETGDKPRSE